MRASDIVGRILLVSLAATAQSGPSGLVRQVVFEGAPALSFSNGTLELTMLSTGGNFVNLRHLEDKAGVSPFWNPSRIARDAGKPARPGGGGHFVCVDGFGTTSDEEKAAGLPGHGEAHRQPWTLVSTEKKDAVLTASFVVQLPLVQEVFRRTIQMVDGEPVVYVNSELESLLAFDRPVNWAEHATIGSPFLKPGKTVVDMSARQSKTRGHDDEENPYPHRLADFVDFTWPLAPGIQGGTVDLRLTPLQPNSLDHTTSLMDNSHKLAFVTALNTEHRLLLGYVFRTQEYPWIQNWESYPPDMGMARGLEISTQPFDIPRRQVIERGRLFGAPVFRWLPAKSKIGSRFLFFYVRAPDGFGKVDEITLRDGNILVEDRTSGQQITVRASLGL